MALATKPLTPSATEPASVLAMLHRDRAEAMDSVKRLTGISARLHAEAAAGASLIDELAKLADAETNDMRAWADGGCQGAAPKGKQAERQTIATKLAGSKTTADAARGAVGSINAKLAEFDQQLVTINDQIEIAALDVAQVEFTQIRVEHTAVIEQVRKSTATLFGMCNFLSMEGRRLNDSGQTDAGRKYLQRAEAAVATANKMAKPDISQAEIMAAADLWGRHVADMRKGG
jgi:hypothetical protein